MFKFFIGADISKSTFDVSYWKGKAIYLGQFSNDLEGFGLCIKALKRQTNCSIQEWFFVFENTGAYSKQLKKLLLFKSIACVEENPLKIKRNAPLKRGKSDPSDALMICEYAVEKQFKLSPDKQTNKSIQKVRLLLNRRDLLVKHKTSAHHSHSEQVVNMPKDVKEQLTLLHLDLLDKINAQIKELEQLIKSYLKEDKEVKNNFDLATSVTGIGLITGAFMICLTNNFTTTTCARQFASYAGVAPFPNESGTMKGKHRVSKLANKQMRSLISNGVISAIQHDPFIKQYHQRLKEKNKPPGVILNNIKNKLIARVFATIKRGTPFVKLAYQ